MAEATEIKAADVQKLRQMTGAGLMDCKKALVESGGDFEKANQILREKGIAKSSKRMDRIAGEGLVDFWISPDTREGILFELNSETDFVARNDEFVALAKKYVSQIQKSPTWTTDQIPQEQALELSAKIGEKIVARRFVHYKSANGVVAAYIHLGSKLGVLIQIDADKPAGAATKELARELALQVAGANPIYVNPSEVPAEVLELEKEITKKQMEGQNKPAEILEKIAIGKLQQYYAANCLIEQPFVRDANGKTTVKELVKVAGEKDGVQLVVARFARFRVGAD